MAEEEEPVPGGEEGGEGSEPVVEPPTTLKVRVESCRNVPDGVRTTVSYSYSLKRPVMNEEGEAEPDEEALTATYEAPEEPDPEDEEAVAPVPNKYDLETVHEIPPVTEELLFRMITAPLEIKVEGFPAPGKVVIPLIDLIFKRDPLPNDPDEDDFLPGAPGAIVRGWYKVVQDGDMPEPEDPPAELAEGEEPPPPLVFPEDAEVFVWLQLSKLLVPLDEVPLLNIVTFTTTSMHNLPERWHLKEGEDNEGHLYKYCLTYCLPGTEAGAEDVMVTVEPGVCVAAYVKPAPVEAEGGEEEGEEEGGGGEGAKKNVEEEEEEEPDVLEKIQRSTAKASVNAEKRGARIEYNHVHSVVMRADQITKLKQVIDNKGFGIELTRALRSDEEYIYTRKYKGVCAPDLAELMKQDQTKCVVRCLVAPHDDYAQPTEDELETTPPPEGEPEDDTEASPYSGARTYVIIRMDTMRALNPKPKPAKKPLPKVGDLVPTRPPEGLSKKDKSPEEGLQDEIRGVVEALADEYVVMFMEPGADTSQLSPDGADERRQKAIFRLNHTGKYYQFKERLAGSVSRVVKEHMMGGRGKVDLKSVEGKRFLSDCYATLQQRVNKALNAIFNPPTKAKRVGEGLSDDELDRLLKEELRLADEAELNLDYTLAALHLNQRILLSPLDHHMWYDHGVMCVRAGNLAKGEECLREALAIDPRHVPSLTAYAVLLCLLENYTNAETFLKGAVDFEPHNSLAWALSVLFYDIESRDGDRRVCLRRYLDVTAEEAGGSESAYLRAGHYAASLNATPLCMRATQQEVGKRGPSQMTRLLQARGLLAAGEFPKCREALAEALAEDKRLAVAMNMKSHSMFLEHGWQSWRSNQPVPPAADIILCYVKASEARVPFIDDLTRLRLGKLYLAERKWYDAKAIFLDACRSGASSTTWLGLAISCLKDGDIAQAEEALSEGNILDPKNAEIWGYLCVCCMKLSNAAGKGREAESAVKLREAEESLKHALSLGISIKETFPVERFIVEQVGDEFRARGLYDMAMSSYERGVEEKNSAPSLCQSMAEVNVTVNDLPRAIECYARIGDCDVATPAQKVHALREAMELSGKLQRIGDANKFKVMLTGVINQGL